MKWPDYMTRESLAKRLELAPGAIDQYVTRGILPGPTMIGEAKRWRWQDVDAWINGVTPGDSADNSDPYIEGVVYGSQKGNRATGAR